MGGSGETQLAVEKFNMRLRETKLLEELSASEKKSKHFRQKKEALHNPNPIIALVGYTNVGKTALLNLCANTDLVSEDKLF